MTDAEAMERLSEGDTDALRVLYDRHRKKVYQLGCRYLGSATDAEDLVQQVFLKVWKAAPGFRGDAKISTWLYRVAANAALDRRRKRRTVGLEDLHPEGSDVLTDRAVLDAEERSGLGRRPGMADVDADADPLRAIHRRTIQERVEEALEELSPSQRMAFVLRHWEGLSIKEIAEVLDVAEGTVKSHIFRAVRALRAELADMTP